MSGHDCPQVLRAGHYGSVCHCRCGWRSEAYGGALGASYAWALHVLEQARLGKPSNRGVAA